MHTYPNARLIPLGRERLLRRHIEDLPELRRAEPLVSALSGNQ